MSSKSELFSTIISLVRTPSVSLSEDILQVSILNILKDLVKTKPSLVFLQSIALVLQKSLLPFVFEITDIFARKSIVLSILLLLKSLLPYHGFAISQENTLTVITKFQLEPGPTSLIALLEKIVTNTDDSTLIETVINVLIIIIENPSLSVTLDIKTSPICQSQIKNMIKALVNKTIPLINPNNFLYKHTAKTFLQFVSRIPELVNLDSYMWAIRLCEDRDGSIRMLS